MRQNSAGPKEMAVDYFRKTAVDGFRIPVPHCLRELLDGNVPPRGISMALYLHEEVLMRLFLTALAATTMMFVFTAASLSDNTKVVTGEKGVLIDQACGANMMSKDDPEAAAAAHPRACAMKESCEKSGYAVIVGKQMFKFNEHGNALAKEFLKKSTKDIDLRVMVEGTVKGDEIEVTAISPAPDPKK